MAAALILLYSTGPLCAADLPREAADILSRRCLGCHGVKTKAGGLDLTARPAAPKLALLAKRVQLGQMPPTAPLPAPEKDTLQRWVDAGAPWTAAIAERRGGPDWWSLQPLHPPSAQSIDDFIQAQLRQNGLTPSAPATRRELIRRVTFDLTGLPPTPEGIDAFLADASPAAYEKLIDRLLASPHYGERWGRHWLDVARFSESEGFERDLARDHSWPYRDYVIRSLNADKPYLDFAREQIAGDVLEHVTHDSIIATGLLVSGPTDAVGLTSAVAREREAVREDQLEETVSTVAQTFLGLTANCARCHDHKFDPIPQKDYYRFKAAFAGVWQPVQDRASIELLPDGRPLLTPAEQAAADVAADKLRTHIDKLEAELANLHRATRTSLLTTRGYQWPTTVPKPIAQWTFDTDARDQHGSLHAPLNDRARVADGRLRPAPGKENVSLFTRQLNRPIEQKTLEAWLWVAKPPEKGSAVLLIQNRSGYRGASLDGIQYGGGKKRQWENQSTARFRSSDVNGPEEQTKAGQRIHIAITYSTDGTISLYRNGQPYGTPYKPEADNAQGRLQTYLPQDAVMQFTASESLELDEARLYDATLTSAQIAQSYAAGAPSITREESLLAMDATGQLRVHTLEEDLVLQRAKLAALPKPEKAFAAVVVEPGLTHLLQRGDVSLKTEVMTPAGLSAIRGLSPDLGLDPAAPDALRRRKMAEWIARPSNPLFARVMVNRVWHYHFGAGIVESPNDFGYNGGQPSHPELLDYLATEFIHSGWSLKRLHRLILLSATYRQSSRYNEQAAKKDAENRLLWRFSPHRLEGEAVRDAMLAVSGALNRQMGGPSFRPFTTTTPGGSYVRYEPRDSAEEALQRRTVYRMNVTTGGDPMLDALDCPVPAVKTPRRAFTTTPLQALSLMNSAFATRMAKTFAARVKREADGVDAQIQRAFRLALGREATAQEMTSSRALVEQEQLETLCWGLFNATEFLQVE